MRVEFHQRANSYDAARAARSAISRHFLQEIKRSDEPGATGKIRLGSIDGVSLGEDFPQLKGWSSGLQSVMASFADLKSGLMNSSLDLVIEHNGHQPVAIGGSFFLRVPFGDGIFLEVNFREELDGSCADPMEILGPPTSENLTLSRVLMAGQRKLTVVEPKFPDSDCRSMASALTRSLQKRQGYYGWEKEGTLDGQDLHSELPLRAARLELTLVEEGFHFTHGTLGPTLRHLAEQYLT